MQEGTRKNNIQSSSSTFPGSIEQQWIPGQKKNGRRDADESSAETGYRE